MKAVESEGALHQMSKILQNQKTFESFDQILSAQLPANASKEGKYPKDSSQELKLDSQELKIDD
jgi:hypothetical protein